VAALVDITAKDVYRPLALIETLQTITIQTVKRIEAVQLCVSFLEHEMKAGKGGIGHRRRIIVRSTYRKLQAQPGEEVEEEVSITVLPPRRGIIGNAEGGFQLLFIGQNSSIDVPLLASAAVTV